MIRSKNFIVETPLYHSQVLVSVNQTDDEVRDILKSRLEQEYHHLIEDFIKIKCNAVVQEFRRNRVCLRFKDLNDDNYVGLIAHEAFHVVENVFHGIGIRHCDKSSEAWAYLLTYYCNEIDKGIKDNQDESLNKE